MKLVGAGVLLVSSVGVNAQACIWAETFEQGPSTQELVLEVKLERNRRVVTDAALAYRLDDAIYLQLLPLLWALELPETTAKDLRATGCYLPLASSYLRQDLIEQLIVARLQLDMPRMAVVIGSDSLFPLEQRLKRERRWSAKPGAARSLFDPDATMLYSPYKWTEFPSASVNLRSTKVLGTNNGASRYDVRLRGDFLKASSDIFIAGGEQQTTRYIGSVYRYDPNGNILGPLNATHARLGDVPGLRDGLVNRGRTGRGARLTNRAANQSGPFGSDVISGVLEPGWSVELFRGNVLLDVQSDSGTGRYEFQDVELEYGNNSFKLVFYGPTGETRTETDSNNVGAAQLQSGDLRYDIVAYENDRNISGERTVSSSSAGLYGKWLQSTIDIGLTQNVSHGLSYSGFEDSDTGVQRLFVSSSLNAKIAGSSSVLLRATREFKTKELGWEIGLLGTAGGGNYSLQHKAYNGLESEWSLRGSAGQLRNESTAIVSWRAPSWWGRPSFNLRVEEDNFESGLTRLKVKSRNTVSLARWSLTDEVTLSRVDDIAMAETIENQIRLRRTFGRLNFRMDMRHRLQSESGFVNGGLELDIKDTDRLRYGFGVNYFESTNDISMTLRANYASDAYTAGVNVRCRTESTCSASVNVRFLLGKGPKAAGFYSNNGNIARKGVVHAKAFHDQNGNGVHDNGEPAIEGVEVRNRRYRNQKMVAGGLPLPEESFHTLTVHATGLESPFMYPAFKSFNVLPRAGHKQLAAIPMVETAEIEGTLVALIGGRTSPIPGVRVQAIASDGLVQTEERAAYDGFFVIDRLPLGRYTVRIHPEDAKKFNLLGAASAEGELTEPGDIFSLGEMVVKSD